MATLRTLRRCRLHRARAQHADAVVAMLTDEFTRTEPLTAALHVGPAVLEPIITWFVHASIDAEMCYIASSRHGGGITSVLVILDATIVPPDDLVAGSPEMAAVYGLLGALSQQWTASNPVPPGRRVDAFMAATAGDWRGQSLAELLMLMATVDLLRRGFREAISCATNRSSRRMLVKWGAEVVAVMPYADVTWNGQAVFPPSQHDDQITVLHLRPARILAALFARPPEYR